MTISTGVGLASGINFEEYISAITEVNRKPIDTIQRKQQGLNTKSEAYSTVSTQLSTLQSSLEGMLTRDQFTFRNVSSSDSKALSATGGNKAVVGTYSVEVQQIAQAERIGSQGVANLEAAIASGEGTFSIQVGPNATRAYDVNATTTLSDLRDMINADSSSDVRANIINDGSPANPYRLVLSSKHTGAVNDIQINSNDTTLNFTTPTIEDVSANAGNAFDGTVTSGGTYTGSGSLNIAVRVTQAGDLSGTASAAQFQVSLDGGISWDSTNYTADSSAPFAIPGAGGVEISFAAGTTNMAAGDEFSFDVIDPMIQKAADSIISVDGIQIRREDTFFTDVIEGVTLDARTLTDGAVSVRVNDSPAEVTALVSKFQETFNSTMKMMKDLTAYNEDTQQAQILFGDSAVRGIRNALNRILTSPVPGLTGEYTTLRSIGLSLGEGGSVNLDSGKLNAAVKEDLEGVMKIFGRIGDTTSTEIEVVDATDATNGDSFAVDITRAAERATWVAGQAIQAGGIANDELLTFTYNDDTFSASLTAGDNTAGVVEKLNRIFGLEGAALEALSEDGVLTIRSTDYGGAQKFSVISDQAANNASTGVGTTLYNAEGQDVAGTINGRLASGEGQILSGLTGTAAAGLELRVTATAPTTGSVTYTRGIADQMLDQITGYIDGEDSVINARKKGLSDTIDSLNSRIERIQERVNRQSEILRKQFIAMESRIASYQGMGSYVSQMMSQLQNIQQQS